MRSQLFSRSMEIRKLRQVCLPSEPLLDHLLCVLLSQEKYIPPYKYIPNYFHVRSESKNILCEREVDPSAVRTSLEISLVG